MGFRREFVGDVHQKHDDQSKSQKNLNISTNFPKVVHFSISLSHQTVINMNNIPNKILMINLINSSRPRGGDMVKPINVAINRAAEILIDKAEYALSQGLVNNFSIDYISIRVNSKCQFEMRQIPSQTRLRTLVRMYGYAAEADREDRSNL